MRRGFTLVELLVATAILAGLVAMASGIFVTYVRESDEKILRYNLNFIRAAIQQFYLDQGRYPLDGYDAWGNRVAFLDSRTSELVQGLFCGVNTYPDKRYRYLQEIPIDPTTNLPNWLILPHDSDGDWKPMDGGGQNDDVGEDGTAGTNDRGEADGVPTRGEPNVDEDPVYPTHVDDDSDGFFDEDPPDCMNVKSSNADFYIY